MTILVFEMENNGAYGPKGRVANFKSQKNALAQALPKNIKVKRKKKFSLSLKKAKKELAPNCQKSGGTFIISEKSGVRINCEGCSHKSDLSDPDCLSNCAKIIWENNCAQLSLNDGLVRKEFDKKACEALLDLHLACEPFLLDFPEECGECGKEHEAQLRSIRKAFLRRPFELLSKGIVCEENPDIKVSGVPKKACLDCERRALGACDNAVDKISKTAIGKGELPGYSLEPFFSGARLSFDISDGEACLMDYGIEGGQVRIEGENNYEKYVITPDEYRFSKEKLVVIKEALFRLKSKKGNIDENTFRRMCSEEMLKLSALHGFGNDESLAMTRALIRSTVGFGLIENILSDPNITDLYINSPVEKNPLVVKHREFGDCETNVYLNEDFIESVISKFRLKSGRPFSQATPILDMDLPELKVRVNVTGPPISPDGAAFAFRKSAKDPWSLLKFIDNGMISSEAAGFLATIVREDTTVLVCGDRGSGKTSLLSALIATLPKKNRILTLEDTFELPVPALISELDFKIQRMRVRPSTSESSFESSSDSAIRSLLRMGDSAIVMGEVRGPEAAVLYEAMNIGGSGNCVLGTIHAKSTRALFERLIYSLKIPPQSFKATDIVIICEMSKSQGDPAPKRRVVEIAEVRKDWEGTDTENVFRTLFKFDAKKGGLVMKNCEDSQVFSKISAKRGLEVSDLLNEALQRGEAYLKAVSLAKNGGKNLLSNSRLQQINQDFERQVSNLSMQCLSK